MAEALPIGVKRIWTEYLPITERRERLVARAKKGEPGLRLAGEGDSQRILQDMIEFHAIGASQRCTTVDSVNRLSRVIPYDPNSNNEAVRMANVIWEALRPKWEAWMAGQDAPINGTPLSVWPGISPEQGELLRSMGLQSVEDVADMSDGLVSKIPIPGARDLKGNAQRFLASSNQAQVAETLKAKEDEIAGMKEQLEEMRQIILDEQQREKSEPKEAKTPKRGPKRKPAKAA